jgi:hypothetical protein
MLLNTIHSDEERIMSKRHFIALADTIKTANHFPDSPVFSQEAIKQLADFCQSQNPEFKRERWLSYIAGTCGKNGGKR